MKKLFAVVLCAVAATAFATPQFGENLTNGKNVVVENSQGNQGFYFSVLSDCSLRLTNDISVAGDKVQNKYAGNSSAYSAVGYFTFDSSGKILTQAELNFDANGIATIDNLKAGDQVGFWVTDANGNTSYSAKAVGGSKNVFDGQVSLGNFSEDWYDRLYGFEVNGKLVLPVLIGTGPSSASPSGQPLPGIIAALVAGGALVGGRALRNRRAAAK